MYNNHEDSEVNKENSTRKLFEYSKSSNDQNTTVDSNKSVSHPDYHFMISGNPNKRLQGSEGRELVDNGTLTL